MRLNNNNSRQFSKAVIRSIGLALLLLIKTANVYADDLITHEGKASTPFQSLMKLTEVPHQETDFSNVKNLVALTQEYWFQGKNNKQRWEFEHRFEEKRAEILPLLSQLNMVDALSPQKKKYEYAIVHGSTGRNVEERIHYLVEQWERGVRFKEVVLLSGKRDLQENAREQKWIDLGLKTEDQMMEHVWNSMELPSELKALPCQLISAPAYKSLDGALRRPGTKETVKEWLKKDPKPGSILALSNQPFCLYSHESIRLLLPPSFELETVGPSARPTTSISNYLDNIARILHEIDNQQVFLLQDLAA